MPHMAVPRDGQPASIACSALGKFAGQPATMLLTSDEAKASGNASCQGRYTNHQNSHSRIEIDHGGKTQMAGMTFPGLAGKAS